MNISVRLYTILHKHGIESIEDMSNYTPDDIIKSSGYHYAFYRVSPVNGNYYSYQKDNNKDNGMDGYAGIWGHFIDRLQIDIR